MLPSTHLRGTMAKAAAATTTETEAPPLTQPWPAIEERYQLAADLGPAFQAMLRLVQDVQRSRFAPGLHAWTSHHDLCVVQQPVSHPHALPHLRISPLEEGRLEFRYVDTTILNRQWHRTVDGDRAFERLALFLEQLHWFG